MTTHIKIIYTVVAFLFSTGAIAQTVDNKKFAIKAHGQIGLGDAISADAIIDGMTGKSTGNEYGVDLGWRFWQKGQHSLEANIGLGYSSVSTRLSLPELNYSYAAPATADMDGEPYIRYTELTDMHQKCSVSLFTMPVYISYAIHCTSWLSIHADLGVRLGFKTSADLSDVSGKAYSYGVYPQYDNLNIDADYMNDFGRREITAERTTSPEASSMTASILAGIGAEFAIYGPLSADLSLRYDAGLSDIYKAGTDIYKSFNANTAPLTYTVNEGTKVKPLTDYLSSSKFSHLSLDISLIYRF